MGCEDSELSCLMLESIVLLAARSVQCIRSNFREAGLRLSWSLIECGGRMKDLATRRFIELGMELWRIGLRIGMVEAL